MKKILFAICASLLFCACEMDFYRKELNVLHDEVDQLKLRLDELCDEMNTNIESLTAILEAVQKNDFVKDIVPIKENGVEIGYVITFSQSGNVTIYHGERGSDGYSPEIGTQKDEDGIWYWTIDGVWMTDSDGNKVRALGMDGATGATGETGAEGVTPMLKVENGDWYVSMDYGASWSYAGKATGDNGEPGKNGDSMFSLIDYTSDPDYLILTLADGETQIKVPTMVAFEELASKVDKLNSDIEKLQKIVEALQGRDYIQSVTDLPDGSGYIISFAKSGSVVICNGEDGKDGHTPAVSVRQNEEDGIWYWTIDGEWLTDEAGNKVVAVGRDGQEGEPGTDGVTPEFKIEEGNWFVSYDKAESWEPLGKATGNQGEQGIQGEKGDSMFSSAAYDGATLALTLIDGTVLELPVVGNLSCTTLTYVPTYSDGNARVFFPDIEESYVEMNFVVSSSSVLTYLESSWESVVSLKAVSLLTKAVSYIDMPVLECIVDKANSILTVKASGAQLPEAFFNGGIAVSASLMIMKDGNKAVSDFVILKPVQTIKRTEYSLTVEVETATDSEKIYQYNNLAGIVSVDYGDETFGKEPTHLYEKAGRYAVTYYFEEALTEIPSFAFYNAQIKKITVPATVATIKNLSLSTPSLETVVFEEDSQLTEIQHGAFQLSALKEIVLPSTVESVGDCVFGGCKELMSVDGAGSDYRVISGAFSKYVSEGTKHFDILIYPSALTTESLQFGGLPCHLKWGAVTYCDNIKRVECPITEIEQHNFYYCSNLESVNLAQVEMMEGNVLVNCPGLKSVSLPKLSAIGKNSICDNETLTEISLGSDSLLEIAEVGSRNKSLNTVSISKGVVKIAGSFNECPALTAIYCKAVNPPVLMDSFDSIPADAVIYVPVEAADAYMTAEGWDGYWSQIQPCDFTQTML